MATRVPWPVKSDHTHATFPAMQYIPDEARPALDAFLDMRVKLSDAEEAMHTAARALATANDAEQKGLLTHLRAGGTAETYERPDTQAKQEALTHARQEAHAYKQLIGEEYLTAMRALSKAAPQGAAQASEELETTHKAYVDAIEEAATARRNYLRAVGLRFFWSHLSAEGNAIAGVGELDAIVLKTGPITRIDDGTFSAMRNDAKAHTRMDDTGTNSW
ncbi:hypothetical protein [Streptomyces sp. NPDC085479]|uniref:hypothetical protein n=1 Tax=Streptomyces sp. NPDC085479 TaxID=3365726 RepID=UPI0037CDC45D